LIRNAYGHLIDHITFHDFLKILQANKKILDRFLEIARRGGRYRDANNISFANIYVNQRRKYLFNAISASNKKHREKGQSIMVSYEGEVEKQAKAM